MDQDIAIRYQPLKGRNVLRSVDEIECNAAFIRIKGQKRAAFFWVCHAPAEMVHGPAPGLRPAPRSLITSAPRSPINFVA